MLFSFMNDLGEPVFADHCSFCELVVVSIQNSLLDSLLIASFFFGMTSVGVMKFMLANPQGVFRYTLRLQRLHFPQFGQFLAHLNSMSDSSALSWFVLL